MPILSYPILSYPILSYPNPPPITAQLVSSALLDKACAWARMRYHKRSPNSDIWHILFHWESMKATIQCKLINHCYQIEPLRRYSSLENIPNIWTAKDAIVLKTLSECLKPWILPQINSHCYYRRGVYSVKNALNAVFHAAKKAKYFFRSDIKSYYASMNHQVVYDDLEKIIAIEPVVKGLLEQYLQYMTTEGGHYWENTLGISLRCPLSPLLGIFYLKDLDDTLTQLKGIQYARYMDDWVILADTRHHFREAIRKMYAVLESRKQVLHPDKTFKGRIEYGIDFLGMRITTTHLSVGQQSITRAASNLVRLYEQGASISRLCQYWQRWVRWICSGIPIVKEVDHWVDAVLEELETSNFPAFQVAKLDRHLRHG